MLGVIKVSGSLGLKCRNFLMALLALRYSTLVSLKTMCECSFIGPCSHRDKDYHIGSDFWKFNLNKTSFTLSEPVSLVKVFRLFRWERIVLVFRVWLWTSVFFFSFLFFFFQFCNVAAVASLQRQILT